MNLKFTNLLQYFLCKNSPRKFNLQIKKIHNQFYPIWCHAYSCVLGYSKFYKDKFDVVHSVRTGKKNLKCSQYEYIYL